MHQLLAIPKPDPLQKLLLFAFHLIICSCLWFATVPALASDLRFRLFSLGTRSTQKRIWSAIYHFSRNNVSLYKHFCIHREGVNWNILLGIFSTSASVSSLIKMTAGEIKNYRSKWSVNESRHGLTNFITKRRQQQATSRLSCTILRIIKANEFLDNVKQQQATNKIDHNTRCFRFRLNSRRRTKSYDYVSLCAFTSVAHRIKIAVLGRWNWDGLLLLFRDIVGM